MENWLIILIIGIYTVAYIVTFIIQSSQIRSNKAVIESMKSFTEIFNVDEVKKFVELKNERIMMEASSLIRNDKKIKAKIDEATKLTEKTFETIVTKQINEMQVENAAFILWLLKSLSKEESVNLINTMLPKSKDYLLRMLEDEENNIS